LSQFCGLDDCALHLRRMRGVSCWILRLLVAHDAAVLPPRGKAGFGTRILQLMLPKFPHYHVNVLHP
jgi:hypothetical protein